MRVGLRQIDSPLIDIGSFKRVNRQYGNKDFVMRAIADHSYNTLVEISNYFYESSGIYSRLCKYLATLYRFDWYATSYVVDDSAATQKKLLKDFAKVLSYLDKSQVKRQFSHAMDIICREGVYYGILLDFGESFGMQQLPRKYCRVRLSSGVLPIVELNLRFFDAYFPQPAMKMKVLKTFPEDVQMAYVMYQKNKLQGDYDGQYTYWYPLDPEMSIKLSLYDNDFPPLVNVIPSIIDLDQAQELDRQKTMQQLLKIIIQKLPLDKNGDLVFDVDEAKDIHNNAVAMLKRAVGIDVLTTFADIETVNTRDNNSVTSSDDLAKVERTVYNNAGTTQNIFNAEGNLAVTNSILNDEAAMRDVPLLFTGLLNRIIKKFNRDNYYTFGAEVLETTQFNYKEMAKLYKEHASLGYAKVLPQVALGHSQSMILANLNFENNILHLADTMQAPVSSNNQSAKNLDRTNQSSSSNSQEKQNGRPKKEEQELSDKSLANRQSES